MKMIRRAQQGNKSSKAKYKVSNLWSECSHVKSSLCKSQIIKQKAASQCSRDIMRSSHDANGVRWFDISGKTRNAFSSITYHGSHFENIASEFNTWEQIKLVNLDVAAVDDLVVHKKWWQK